MAEAPGPSAEAPVALPAGVRERVVSLAADALGAMPVEEVPASLRPFARFTPTRRVRLAGTPIAAALAGDVEFRQRVAQRVRDGVPHLAALLDAGLAPAAADPLDVAATAYLLRPSGWPELVAAAGDEAARAQRVASSAVAEETVTRLQEQLAAVRAQGRTDLGRTRAELAAAKAEVTQLRRKLHDAREGRRAAEAAAAQARRDADAGIADAAAASSAADVELRRLRARLAETEAALETARRSAREGRALADARLRLLLDTVVDAASGLRRELALPPTQLRPADVVAAVVPGEPGVGDVAERALAADDPALLDQLLALPQVHLVVDGYNVTKLGYGTLPLQVQRDRLAGGLAGIAARSGAEVTLVWDGAALDGPVLAASPRGVRVLFSSPGETADALIRRLVANEPPGRAVVVVSTDREVAEGVRRSGARDVPSAALLKRLDRG